MPIYLDNAATTPVCPEAARAAYETAVAKVAFGLCAGDSVVLMTRRGRIMSQMY